MEKTNRYENRYVDFGSYDHAELARSYVEILNSLHLSSESVVLEFGAGQGNEAKQMRESSGARVVELDVSLAAYRTSPSPERKFAVADYHKLPYTDNYFSIVHCKDALVHIEDKDVLFKEFRRVLKPGGMLLLTTQTKDEIDISNNSHFSVTEKVLKELLQKTGFKLTKTSNWKPEEESNWHKLNRVVLLLENMKS